MNVVADTGALYVLYDADDQDHQRVAGALDTVHGSICVPAAVLGEIGYLLREWLGVDAELAFLASLRSGAFQLAEFTEADLARCEQLLATYRDLNIGLVDAAVVATAERLGIQTVLTLDERDFRAIRPKGGPFRLLPADL